MRFVVLGTSEFTLCCARGLLDMGGEICALISMPESTRPDNSADIAKFAEKNAIPYYEIEDINSPENIRLLKNCSSDYIFSSWPKIIHKEVLNVPKYYCIGTHPTELPFNRGRHPLHWLIAQGITSSKLSFFKMDEGIDSGNILLQIPFEISSKDFIIDVIDKINEVAYEGIKILYKVLHENYFYNGIEQDHKKANYWRKRTPHDVTLDIRMSADVILRIVRSFAPPYPCANLVFEQYNIKISNASIIHTNLSDDELRRIEPGKIINIKEKRIGVKVDDQIIDLECATPIPSNLMKAKYIHPPSKYLSE